MNAISPIAVPDDVPPLPKPASGQTGHVFRSRLIDKLAAVETWAVGRLRAADANKKLQPTLGLRLGAVRKLTETHPHLFRKASTVAQLFDELRPFQDLRSSLAHATLTEAVTSDGTVICAFERADSDGLRPWLDRIVLREAEFRRILGRVSDLAHKLEQQVVRTAEP